MLKLDFEVDLEVFASTSTTVSLSHTLFVSEQQEDAIDVRLLSCPLKSEHFGLVQLTEEPNDPPVTAAPMDKSHVTEPMGEAPL